MKLRRIMLPLVCFLFAFSSVCCAYKEAPYINGGEITLGGISLGASSDYVRSIYGEPTSVSRASHSGPFGVTTTWKYGNSFIVQFTENGCVYGMKTTANNGIKTKSGSHVGQKISAVTNYFGNAVTHTEDHGDDYYRVKANWYTYMVFETGIWSSKITEISCYTTP